jgi:hypothetical protein
MRLAVEHRRSEGVHRSFPADNAAQDDTESAGKVKIYAAVEGGERIMLACGA